MDAPTTPFLGGAAPAPQPAQRGGKWRRYALTSTGVASLLLVACFAGYEAGVKTDTSSSSSSKSTHNSYSSGTTATTVSDKKLLTIATASEYDQPSSLKHYAWLENKVRVPFVRCPLNFLRAARHDRAHFGARRGDEEI